MFLRLISRTLLLGLLAHLPPAGAQEAERALRDTEWEPSKYRIIKSHILPMPRGPQAAVSQGRFIINFGSREGVQPGSIFRARQHLPRHEPRPAHGPGAHPPRLAR